MGLLGGLGEADAKPLYGMYTFLPGFVYKLYTQRISLPSGSFTDS